MKNRRFRLHFIDRDILTASQKNQGFNRSWLLLKPRLKTVADLVHYVTRLFKIDNSCPDGILLYVDGFALPEFESVVVVKDNDLICVKRRRRIRDDESKFLGVEGAVERRDLGVDGRLLLANEEFENEICGYESEEEEEEALDERMVEKSPGRELKKRKAERKANSPKKKKRKHVEKAVFEEDEIDPLVLKECKLEGGKVLAKKVENGKQLELSIPAKVKIVKQGTRSNHGTENMCTNIQENGGCSRDTSQLPGDCTKCPSRSARRKKAKRRWLREKLMLQNELQQKKEVDKVFLNSAENDHHESVEKDHQELVEKDCQESSEDSSEESSKGCSEEAVMKEKGTPITKDDQSSDESSEETEDEVIPVEIRPGHIRFESRSKGDTDNSYHDPLHIHNPVDNFHWTGITSKKKGQKWGTTKDTNRSRNDNSHQETSRMTTITSSNDVVTVTERCTLDFEKLEPYVGLPKTGDVVAYRLMELSSSWCPEVSSFRVGKVSSYDTEANVIRLDSVPEYPFTIENNQEHYEEEDGVPELESDTSPYDADGSLEVEYSSIVDPRIVKRAVVTETKAKGTTAEKDGNKLNNGSSHMEKKASKPTPANGTPANSWDEVIQVLSAKKQELSAKVNGDEKNSGKNTWSLRAMRGSAIGPIMARLREQNELEGK